MRKSLLLFIIILFNVFVSTAGTITVKESNTTVTSLSSFSGCSGSASNSKLINVAGFSLTSDVVITPSSSDFEVSTSANFLTNVGTSSVGITLSRTGNVGNIGEFVYVRMTGSATGSPSGNLIITSTGSTTSNIGLSGLVGPSAPTLTVGSVSNITTNSSTFNVPFTTTGSPNQYTVTPNNSGTRMYSFNSISYMNQTLTSSPISLSTTGGGSMLTTGTYDFIMNVKNTLTGCMSANASFTVTVNAPVVPALYATASLSSFTTCAGTASTGQAVNLTATNLGTTLFVRPPNGYEISTTSNFATTYTRTTTPQLSIVTTAGSVNSAIYLRLSSSASEGAYTAGTFSYMSDGSPIGASSMPIFPSGTVTAVPTISLGTISNVSATATSFDIPFTATTGTPNQYSIIPGTNALPGFTPVGYTSLGSSPIRVTIPAGQSGTKDFNLRVKNTTTGCSSPSYAISLTVDASQSQAATLVTSATTLATMNKCEGASSSMVSSFNVSGSNIDSGGVTITPPVGFELSTSSDFATVVSAPNTLSLTAAAGTVSTTVYARLASNNTAGDYNGSIVFATTAGTLSTSVSLVGTVNALPTITVGKVTSFRATETSFAIPYTATTGSPDLYSISAGSIPLAGFTDVSNSSLTTSPINITIPASLQGAYNFNLTVKNATTACSSSSVTVPVTILPALDSITGLNLLCGKTNIQLANTTQGGVWTSSNTNLLTVNTNGKLTGVGDADGQVVITYTVIIHGITYSTTKTVNYVGSPLAAIKMPTVDAVANQLTPLQARTFGVSYNWITKSTSNVGSSAFLTNTAISNPNLVINAASLFNIEIKAANGCITVDTLEAKVFTERAAYLPTAFSPNGDGINDEFKIVPVGITGLRYFRIMNQFGQIVFETTNLSQGWDGRTGGVAQPIATYIWVVASLDINGNVINQNGSITLIR